MIICRTGKDKKTERNESKGVIENEGRDIYNTLIISMTYDKESESERRGIQCLGLGI